MSITGIPYTFIMKYFALRHIKKGKDHFKPNDEIPEGYLSDSATLRYIKSGLIRAVAPVKPTPKKRKARSRKTFK